MRRNRHHNVGRHRRSSRNPIAEVHVKRLNIGARTDGAQIHRRTAGVYAEFFGNRHEFAPEPFSLLRRIDAQQTEVHAVRLFLEIDATDEGVIFFEQEELAGAQIFQRSVAVDSFSTDEGAFDFKRGIDE